MEVRLCPKNPEHGPMTESSAGHRYQRWCKACRRRKPRPPGWKPKPKRKPIEPKISTIICPKNPAHGFLSEGVNRKRTFRWCKECRKVKNLPPEVAEARRVNKRRWRDEIRRLRDARWEVYLEARRRGANKARQRRTAGREAIREKLNQMTPLQRLAIGAWK